MSKKDNDSKKSKKDPNSLADKLKAQINKCLESKEYGQALDTLTSFLGKDSPESKKVKKVKKKVEKLAKTVEATVRELEGRSKKLAKEVSDMFDK